MRVNQKYPDKQQFARECRDTTMPYFKPRIANCENKAWLREAVKVEAESEARRTRIQIINQRIQEL